MVISYSLAVSLLMRSLSSPYRLLILSIVGLSCMAAMLTSACFLVSGKVAVLTKTVSNMMENPYE